MIIQLSSGQGPAECELAVYKLYIALKKEFPDINLIAEHKSKHSGYFTSIQFSTDYDLSFLEGSVQWICKSPLRPKHKRKNWFVDVSILKHDAKKDKLAIFQANQEMEIVDQPVLKKMPERELEWSYFHCSGKGGQNVNKVETGVRLKHLPTGIVITSTAHRNQLQNRKEALNRLYKKLRSLYENQRSTDTNEAWSEHNKIVRGNPTRIYVGENFRLKETF